MCSGVGAKVADNGLCECGVNAVSKLIGGVAVCTCDKESFFFQSALDPNMCKKCQYGKLSLLNLLLVSH